MLIKLSPLVTINVDPRYVASVHTKPVFKADSAEVAGWKAAVCMKNNVEYDTGLFYSLEDAAARVDELSTSLREELFG